jgi:hypothetical protein
MLKPFKMKTRLMFKTSLFAAIFLVFPYLLLAQARKSRSWTLDEASQVTIHGVNVSPATYEGAKALRVDYVEGEGESHYAKLLECDFSNGTIELKLAGKPGENAGQEARGFVGVAFRIADDDIHFECIYLRPANGRANDQLRRNHSTQYISSPDYPWYRLREETPGKYESYVDLVTGEWTRVKIEVSGDQAKLFLHGSDQPCLIVNDLKLGPDQKGSIGLWVGVGTEAYFSNLTVVNH